MSQRKYWVWLSTLSELSVKTKYTLLEHYADPQELFFAPVEKLKAVCELTQKEEKQLNDRTLDKANAVMGKCDEQNLTVITMQDSNYPKRLKNIAYPPLVLYVKGKLPIMDDEAAVAIIGTRKASLYGLKCADKLGREIVGCGGVVLSGLTHGIEASAAKSAVDAGGRVVAVLGTPHECDNSYLSKAVLFGGAIVSEYAPGTVPMKSFFRDRNRITSGLSVGTVVVEAPEKSGTMGFVEEATEQGRDIFAVPGGIDNPNCAGTNKMIRDGAVLVNNGWDVMSEYEKAFPERVKRAESIDIADNVEPIDTVLKVAERADSEKKKVDKPAPAEYIDLREQLKELDEVQLNILSAIGKQSDHVDEIIAETGYSAAKVLAQLTVLEIKGYVRRENGKRYALNVVKK